MANINVFTTKANMSAINKKKQQTSTNILKRY